MLKKFITAIINGYRKKWFRRMITIISGIIVVIGLISAILSILPRLTINPGEEFDPSNPLATPFYISNDGPLPVYNIMYKFAMLHLSAGGRSKVELHGRNVFVTNSRIKIPSLKPAKKASLICPPGLNRTIDILHQCEIEIVISYKPFGWPFVKEERHRFLAVKDINGQWKWIPKATSEKY